MLKYNMILPYKPKRLPPKFKMNRLHDVLIEAVKSIIRFDESVLQLPEPRILQYTLQTNEAILSSKIEGTQITLQQMFLLETMQNSEKTNIEQDYQEVRNYRNAINYGYNYLNKRKKIGVKLIKDLHRILLNSVRGKDKSPGKYRRVQVFIGKPGATINQASFIPPKTNNVAMYVRELLHFMYSQDGIDPVLKAGIMHFQFEAIHPFEDGNGRIGRILVPLYLFSKGITHYPNIYVSEFFETYRQEYYEALRSVSKYNKWEVWLKFFLQAIQEQTQTSYRKVNDIKNLYLELKQWAQSQRSFYILSVIDVLFMSPVITPTLLKDKLEIKSRQTAYNILDKLAQNKILVPSKGLLDGNSQIVRQKYVYIFKKLMDIVERRYKYN